MQTSEALDQLLPALRQARSLMPVVSRTGRNEYDKYDYAREEDWHKAIMEPLLNNGLILICSCETLDNLSPRTSAKGTEQHAVTVSGKARLIHTSGQWIEVCGFGQGEDRSDKACYKAQTGLKKYLYALLFCMPTGQDPEVPQAGRGRKKPVAGERAPGPPPAATPQEPQKPAEPKMATAEEFTKIILRIQTLSTATGCDEALRWIEGQAQRYTAQQMETFRGAIKAKRAEARS